MKQETLLNSNLEYYNTIKADHKNKAPRKNEWVMRSLLVRLSCNISITNHYYFGWNFLHLNLIEFREMVKMTCHFFLIFIWLIVERNRDDKQHCKEMKDAIFHRNFFNNFSTWYYRAFHNCIVLNIVQWNIGKIINWILKMSWGSSTLQ